MDVGMVKKSAKSLLKDYWVRSITAVMLVISVSALVSLVAQFTLDITKTDYTSTTGYVILLAASAVGSFLSEPVLLGYRRILWLRSEGVEAPFADVFYYFGKIKLLFKYLLLNLLRSLLILLPLALLSAPVFAFVYFAEVDISFLTDPHISTSLDNIDIMFIIKLCCILLVIGGALLSALQALRYTVSDFIFINDPKGGVLNALRTSSRLCMGCKWRIIMLYLSFVPWFLLNSTGFGRLYSVPYFSAALVRATRVMLANEEATYIEQPTAPIEQTVVFEAPTEGGTQ